MLHPIKVGIIFIQGTIMKTRISLILFSVMSMPLIAQPTQTLVLDAVKDNTLYQINTGSLSNAQGSLFVGVTNQFLIRRAVVQFNFDGLSVDISKVDSVKLRLSPSMFSPGATEMTMHIHALGKEWGEGTSLAPAPGGNGAVSTIDDATWIHAKYPDDHWATPGGDFNATRLSDFNVRIVDQVVMSRHTEAFIDMMESWILNPETNFGLLVKNEDEATPQQAVRFASRETATNDASRPALVIYHRDAFTTSIEPHPEERSDEGPMLLNNYPNPFNPKTVIGYRISEIGRINIEVYNQLGQRITTLFDGVQAPGQHSVTFDAAGLPSGMYIVVLESGGMRDVRKITLLK
jgi:hypothetical protein